jgi:hypothetical protein
MGAEAQCTITIKGKTTRGRAKLETDVLQFRGGGVSLSVPFARMESVIAADGALSFNAPAGRVVLQLGSAAPRWADRILHPPSRLQKIGVKADWRAAALGITDLAFLNELQAAVGFLSIGRVVKHCDAIFFGASRAQQLTRLRQLKASLKPNGALWVVRPKGRPEISEAEVMAAGKAAGLVDVKVVGISPTHTAEKFVIPLADR